MITYNGISIIPKGNRILVKVKGKTFFAEYPFTMDDVAEDLLWGMMYTLFIGLEDIPPPQQKVKRDYTKTMLSFSGGVDSYAIYEMIDCIPVYLNRIYSPEYGKSQQEIIKAVGSIVVDNNLEQIRTLYRKPHGFNWGSGYVALLLPLSDYLQAGYMALGTVFDDACYSPKEGKVYFNNIHKTEHYVNIDQTGVKIIWPAIGISEIITTEVARSGQYANLVSSCHFTEKKDCGKCVKCIRKLNNIEITTEVEKKIEAWKKYPKMSLSMVHKLKQYYSTYNKIDTSLVYDIHEHITRRWNPDHVTAQILRLNYNKVNVDDKCIEFANQYNAL